MTQTGPGSNSGVLQVRTPWLVHFSLPDQPPPHSQFRERRNVTLRPQGIPGELRLRHLVETQISWGCLRVEMRLSLPERGEAGRCFLSAEPAPSSRPCLSGTCRFSSATYASAMLCTHARQFGLHCEFQSGQGYKHSEARCFFYYYYYYLLFPATIATSGRNAD